MSSRPDNPHDDVDREARDDFLHGDWQRPPGAHRTMSPEAQAQIEHDFEHDRSMGRHDDFGGYVFADDNDEEF